MGLKCFKLFAALFLLAAPSILRAQFGGDGIYGVYYNGINFNTAAVSEVDPSVDFLWQGCMNVPGVSATAFSVKWTGQIEPAYSQAYTFTAAVNGGVSLIVNGQVLVNQWTENTTTSYFTGTINLTAGVTVPMEVDYFANGGSPQMQVFWQCASQPYAVIPREDSFSGTNPGPAPTPQVVTACGQTAMIDGVLNEPPWNEGLPFSQVTKTVSGQVFGTTALFKIVWDANNLYLGTQVMDSQLTNVGTNEPYTGSAVELFLNMDNDRSITITSHDFQYVFGWGQTTPWESLNRITGVTMKTPPTSTGYIVEASIPWSTLGVTPLQGTVLGFDVGVDVNHNGGICRDGQMMFNGNTDNYLDTSAYGVLDLGTACPTPVATPPAPNNKPYVYSNPSSGPNVTFVYDMAENGSVQIGVLNDAGDVVATIQDKKPPGVQESVLNIQSFAPGHYFYRVVLSYNSGRKNVYAPAVLAVFK